MKLELWRKDRERGPIKPVPVFTTPGRLNPSSALKFGWVGQSEYSAVQTGYQGTINYTSNSISYNCKINTHTVCYAQWCECTCHENDPKHGYEFIH